MINSKNNTKLKKHIQAKCDPSDIVNFSLIDIVDLHNIEQIPSRRKRHSFLILVQLSIDGP